MTEQTEVAPIVAKPTGALVQVEVQRGIAEIQARMMLARANPRDPVKCLDLILQDCTNMALAEEAVYDYARGGTKISAPSIKLIQAIARRWGNIASGITEISRANGSSEMLAEAWDLESGYYDYRKFQVKHWRDRDKGKGGGYQLTDERDIYELTANMGQRRKRAVMEAVIPTDVVEAAVAQCEVTMKAKADTSPEHMKKMIEAFGAFSVTKEQIEKRIQRRIDAIQPAQVVSLKKIYASLRDGMSVAADWFEVEAEQTAASPAETVKETLRARKSERVADPFVDEMNAAEKKA
jgi:hypothetical protein